MNAAVCGVGKRYDCALVIRRLPCRFHSAVNIPLCVPRGGVGTLIASLASLITFREYCRHNPGKAGYYVRTFSLFNFGFLIILTGFMMLLKSMC